MLIRFAVENFMSFGDRAELDLRGPGRAGGGGPGATALPDGTHALSRVLLVGENGAGKTAVLKALGVLRTLVLAGTRPGQALPLVPNRLLPGEPPTHFTLELLHDGTLWTYSLTARRELVETESLHAVVAPGQPGGGLVFSRARPSALIPSTAIKLGEAVAGERERLQLIAQATRPEQPFLSEALRRGSPVVAPLGAWLRERLQLVRAEAKIVGVAARCAREPAFAHFLTSLLAASGTGVSEVTTAHTRVDPDYFETEEEKKQVVAALTGYADGFVQTEQGEIIAVQDGRLVDLYQIRLRVLQRGPAGAVELPVGELSDGVLRLMHLAPLLYEGGAAAPPQVFFVDELDRSLHPRVTRQLLTQFAAQALAAPQSAHGRAQLVATTHDAALLSAVQPSEVRLIVPATPTDPARAAQATRIGGVSGDLSGDEMARRFIAGSLEVAERRGLPN